MTPITAIDHATEFWLRRESMTEQDKLDAALALIEWPEVDEEMVFAITGIGVNGFRPGSGRGAGKGRGRRTEFNPSNLNLIHQLAIAKRRGDKTDWNTVQIIVEDGTSIKVLSDLSGLSRGWVSRKLRNLKGVPFDQMDSALKARGSQ